MARYVPLKTLQVRGSIPPGAAAVACVAGLCVIVERVQRAWVAESLATSELRARSDLRAHQALLLTVCWNAVSDAHSRPGQTRTIVLDPPHTVRHSASHCLV